MNYCNETELLKQKVLSCSLCSAQDRLSPPVFFSPNLGSKVMIIGRSPGGEEHASGVGFVGPGGRILWQLLGDRNQYSIANVLCCYFQGDRAPKKDEYSCCYPFIDEFVKLQAPRLILGLGNDCVRLLVDNWKYESVVYSGGKTVFLKRYNSVLFPALHPGYVLRKQDLFDFWKLQLNKFLQLSAAVSSMSDEVWQAKCVIWSKES